MTKNTYVYEKIHISNIQTDRYFIDSKKIITNLFVIEMKEIYVHVYTTLLIC